MMDGWIVGLGEVLWDVFQDGPRFGGAPANFACHARALCGPAGGTVAMVSAVGPESDPLAGQALEQLQQHGVDTRWMTRNDHETGRVIVDVDQQGHPTYTFSPHPAWDFMHWHDGLAELAANCSAVCFGTLAQRAEPSRTTIGRFLANVPSQALKIFDVNLRVDYWTEQVIFQSLQQANVLKLNLDELPVVAQACTITQPSEQIQNLDLTGSSPDAYWPILARLRKRFDLQAIALTCGADGAALLTADARHYCPAPSTRVRDTVGAGDSYTAALMVGLKLGWPIDQINQRAVAVAAYVCTQSGATPPLPEELIRPYK